MNFSVKNIIDKEIKNYEGSFNRKASTSKIIILLNRITRSNIFILSPLKRLINNYNHYKSIRGYYKVTPSNRMFSLEFINYLVENGDSFIPETYSFYNDKISKETLDKLYRNKTLCATYNFISKDYLFSNTDINEIKRREKLKIENTKENKKYVQIFGYSFLKPFIYESSVFINKLGLKYLSKNAINQKNNNKLVIIDCGAFNGDSAFILNEFFPNNPIFAFEMIPENYNNLKLNISKNNLSNRIFPHKLAVGSKNAQVTTSIDNGIMAKISTEESDSTNSIEMVTIDSFIKDKDVALIKMDIEGAEIDALRGSLEIIKKNQPILIIALYHKTEDLTVIPKMINDLNLGYSFKLRHLKAESPVIDYMLICEPPH